MHISRRLFLKLVSMGIFSTLLGRIAPVLAAESTDIIYLRQMITTDSSTTRLIVWQSVHPHKSALVRYKASGSDALWHEAPVVSQAFTDDNTTIYLHQAQLEGLQPGTAYEYQAKQDGVASPIHKLTTPDATSLRAIVFPDSQCTDGYATWHDVAHSAFQQQGIPDFFINMGDLVDNGEAGYQWRQWFSAVEDLMPHTTFVPVMGNHETYDLNWKCRIPKAHLAYFPVPDNGSNNLQHYYYSFDYGPVHFIVLNTQFEELASIQPDMMPQQLAWLEQDAATTTKKWKVVLMHKDVIDYDHLTSKEPLADIDPVGKRFMPYFDRLGIHLVLTAHQHTYRRHNHIFNFAPSEHGPVYIDTGVAGNCRYNVPRTQRFDKVMLPQPETDNYLTLTADNNKLVVKCFLPNGQELDSYFLEG